MKDFSVHGTGAQRGTSESEAGVALSMGSEKVKDALGGIKDFNGQGGWGTARPRRKWAHSGLQDGKRWVTNSLKKMKDVGGQVRWATRTKKIQPRKGQAGASKDRIQKTLKSADEGGEDAGWARQNAHDCSESDSCSKNRAKLEPRTGCRIKCRQRNVWAQRAPTPPPTRPPNTDR